MAVAFRYKTDINLSASYQRPTPTTVSHHLATATVGIAIPSYRAAGTLEETLRSCVTQTFEDWIAFVTVDGEDATHETDIVRAVDDPRILLECNGTRLGQMANFNRAVLRCYAAGVKWIKTLSADDLLYPDALQRMVELGNVDSNCGLVFGYFDFIDGTDAVLAKYDLESLESRIVPSREFTRRIVPFGNPMGGPSSVMFRAFAIERSGLFDGSLNYTGDREYWFRLGSKYNVGVVGKRAVLAYRHHANSVSGREHATAVRFEQSIDVARLIVSRYPPYSYMWFLSHIQIGRAAASNLVTAAGFARRGKLEVAAMALAITVRRLSIISFPVALWQCSRILADMAFGWQSLPNEFEPRIVNQKKTT
jgi:glycosyltransferase involved in cell wall biosynthesis